MRTHARIQLADPGALLATTHVVGDSGERVRLRLARPSDVAGVEEFLAGLSEATRQHVPIPSARHFTYYDVRTRLVVAAALPLSTGEQIVGLADCTLLDTGLAQLAVVVADERQGTGVGKLLTEVIAALALRQGAHSLKAEMTGDNPPMRALMKRLGRTVETVEDGKTVAHTKLPPARRRAA